MLKVALAAGSVVLPGDPVAMIAEQNFVHAATGAGTACAVSEGRRPGPRRWRRFRREAAPRFGTISLVYPQIEDGRVIADATVENLGEYFVGDRLRVWISGGERTAFVIPSSFMTTRFGIDYVQLRQGDRTDQCAGAAWSRPAFRLGASERPRNSLVRLSRSRPHRSLVQP